MDFFRASYVSLRYFGAKRQQYDRPWLGASSKCYIPSINQTPTNCNLIKLIMIQYANAKYILKIIYNLSVTKFKVVWDTLQYFQGWQDSKKMITTTFLKISKSICPQNALKNSTWEIKGKTGAWFERATHRLLAYPSTNWAT